MKRYRVVKEYGSSWGVLTRNQIIELDDDTAAWINRDGNGVLVLDVPEPPPEPVKPTRFVVAKSSAPEEPEVDRMIHEVKRGPGRPRKDGS